MDVMYINDHIRELLGNNELSPGELKKKGDKTFFSVLRKEGMKKVLAGETTLKEVKRITMEAGQ